MRSRSFHNKFQAHPNSLVSQIVSSFPTILLGLCKENALWLLNTKQLKTYIWDFQIRNLFILFSVARFRYFLYSPNFVTVECMHIHFKALKQNKLGIVYCITNGKNTQVARRYEMKGTRLEGGGICISSPPP